MPAIRSTSVTVDDDVSGERWTVGDFDALARLVAVITIGQAEHAARIIAELEPHGPALSDAQLFAGARGQLRIRGGTASQQEVSRYHRDGFLFECISWIEARQAAGDRTFMKDPHITSTAQGLDGLMIEMHPTEQIVTQSTIFEDKCTENPRDKFRDEVLPTFTDHHESKRSRELVANAVILIKESGLNGTDAVKAAAVVLDRKYRTYRAALTVGSNVASAAARKKLFKGYNGLADLDPAQRLGATFVLQGDLRGWFQSLADAAVQALAEFEAPHV